MLQHACRPSSLLLLVISLLPIGVAKIYGQVIPEPPFTYEFIELNLAQMGLSGLDYADAEWGDQDLDGDLDLLVTGLTNGGPVTRVYMNISEEQFGTEDDPSWRQHYDARSQGITPLWLGDIAWIDINNDGLLEFVVSGVSNTDPPFSFATQIYAPVGTVYMPVPAHRLTGVSGGSLDWGDYDNDGDPDLLITGQQHEEIIVGLYENTDSGLRDSGITLPFTSIGESKFGDFDSDGDLDIILTAVYTSTGLATTLLRNDGAVFNEVETDFPGLGFSSVDWGDYDNDGDLDVLLSGGVLSPLVVEERTRVFRNEGGGRFTDIEAALDDAAFGTARWGDYDNDGFLDIVIAGSKGVRGEVLTRLYRNQGDHTFRAAINLAGLRFGKLGFGDYDADGDLDVVVAGSGRLIQYRNDHRRVNNPPSPPTNLQVGKSSGLISLRWDAATDPETPSPGLTYNIRIGSKPRSLDVLSPMADVDSGRRLVVGMGNVQNNTSWQIRNLPPGRYYWSVQAIDQSFQGSAWAEEVTFEISASEKSTTAAETSELSDEVEVVRAYPNPFDPDRTGTTIEFHLRETQVLRISVYSILGTRIATLAERQFGSGWHRVLWDGASPNAPPAGAGVYLVRVDGERDAKTIQVIRMSS